MDDSGSCLADEKLSVDDDLALTEHGHAAPATLGALCYSAEATRRLDLDFPCLNVPLLRLDRAEPGYEIWRSGGQLATGQQGDVHYRRNEEFAFGTIVLSEDCFASEVGRTPLQQATESAYHQVFTLLEHLSMPYPFRFWNYVPGINTHSHGSERYQQFNSGRQTAFLAHARDVQGNLPAACALGTEQGSLSIAFLAGRTLPQGIENPRQISAFNYPAQYGTRSPTFARASLVKTNGGEIVLISGTASVVGHASRHPGDAEAQTRETMANIEALLDEANRLSKCDSFVVSDLDYRVYLRRPDDLERVRGVMAQCVAEPFKAVYLQADICRQELLVEIEATAVSNSGRRS